MKFAKLATAFVVVNAVVGLGALIGTLIVGEAGSAKTFYTCEGLLITALFNMALAMLAGLLFKDEETQVGRITTWIAVVNTIIGLVPLIGMCMVGDTGSAKAFYSCAGMFATTSFDVLLAIMVGMSSDIFE